MTNELITSAGLTVISRDQWGPDLGLVSHGTWREIVGPAQGAVCRSLYDVVIAPEGATDSLVHPGEAVYYVVDGSATAVERTLSGDVCHELSAGGMIHIPGGANYSLRSTDGARLIGGPCPVDELLGERLASPLADAVLSAHHRDRPGLLVPFISKDARLVVWLGAGAETANMNYVVLEPGERNKEHVHAISEDTIHILEGHGTAENVTTGDRLAFGPGDTIHIEIGFWHAVAADRGERVVSVGGPCPADTDMLRAAGVDVDALLAAGEA